MSRRPHWKGIVARADRGLDRNVHRGYMIAMTYNEEGEVTGPPLPETTLIEGAAWWVGDDDWRRVWRWLNKNLGTRKTGLWYAFRAAQGHRMVVIVDRHNADAFAIWEGRVGVP